MVFLFALNSAQLVVVRMWNIYDRSRIVMDVYITSFPLCSCLSVDRLEFRVRFLCRYINLPRDRQLGQLDWHRMYINRLLSHRKMKKYILFIFLFVSLTIQAEVQIALLRKAEANFKQTRTSMVLTEPIVQRGFFAYVAPDSICWKYDELDNLRLPEQMLSLIKQAVSGDLESAKNTFETKWDKQALTLVPKKKQIQKIFQQIIILFDTNGVATKVYLEEPNGDQTKIEFINMKYTTL